MKNIPFVDDESRQRKARDLSEAKYLSGDDRSYGLLKDFDNNLNLVKEVKRRKPWKIYVVCLAGENRSRLIAEVLEDKDIEGNNLNYVAAYGGTNFSFPVMEEEICSFEPDAIIFATRQTERVFRNKFAKVTCDLDDGKILGRVIGLGDSGVALALEKGKDRVGELKERIKRRLIEMGLEGLSEEDLQEKWAELV